MHSVSTRINIAAQRIKCRSPKWRCSVSHTCIAALAAFVLGGFMLALCAVRKSTPGSRYSTYLLDALKGPLQYNDPELLDYVRNEVLIPPSSLPYALEGRRNAALVHVHPSETFYRNASRLIFQGREKRTFVEAGALDGETMSNSLGLEKNHGWSGLLVEADKGAFAQLLQKRRKAWLANVCLAPAAYPSVELFASKSLHLSVASGHYAGYKHRAMGKLQKYRPGATLRKGWVKRVQCLPLGTLLLALDFLRVDLLVLDVEGAEMDIIRTLDFTVFDVQVIYLEWKDLSKHHEISEEIKKQGYRLVLHLSEDFVFLKKNTEYDAVLPGVDINLAKS